MRQVICQKHLSYGQNKVRILVFINLFIIFQLSITFPSFLTDLHDIKSVFIASYKDRRTVGKREGGREGYSFLR